MATEPTTTAGGTMCSDDDESVRFDFGDDYGSRREFVELGKELLFWNLCYLRVPRREEDDVLELWSPEEVLQEFVKNHLF
nr:hypothetical protein Iba_chr11dCG8260 [Ipomoea batatas]